MDEHKLRVGAGMGAFLMGGKLPALGMFARGAAGLERQWRDDNGFDGTRRERFERASAFYDETHQDPTNRALHVVGIPMIAGGALGMLLSPSFTPPWLVGAASFSTGWALNLMGHAVFEKSAPAFFSDPLAFVAGPVWDAKNLLAKLRGKGGKVHVDPQVASAA